jgi:glutaconate CoA-transferase, subunit B
LSFPVPRHIETIEPHYTPGEMMVIAAAREIRDGELVFVGMRLPLLAFLLAQKTRAPRAIALFENGVIRESPSAEMLYTMGDPANIRGASQCGQLLDVMGFLQQGRVDLGLVGGAEIDRFGNLNSTWGRQNGEAHRLPGSGGACDIACLARRTVAMIRHERERLCERVGFVTSPGFGDGDDWRRREGLPTYSGPAGVVTTMGILRFGSDGEAQLNSIYPGVKMEDVLANTAWTLRVADELLETPAPTGAELSTLRELDPKHFWTR